MNFPIYTARQGDPLKAPFLIELAKDQMIYHIDWPTSLKKICKNNKGILDLGPGSSNADDGLFRLTKKALIGTGFSCFTTMDPNYKDLLQIKEESWREKFGIKKINGKLVTKFTSRLGKPPVCVAGMTPCTVWPEIVLAISNAGYYIPKGEGININILYLNARLWGFQYKLSLNY